MRRQLPVLFFCLALAASGLAATLNVPSEYTDLSAALAAVQPGDSILLDSGLYSGPGFVDLVYDTPGPLALVAPYGPETTEIDLESGVFVFIGDPENDTLPPQLNLLGLTIKNGEVAIEIDSNGTLGAVNCLLVNNTIVANAAGSDASVVLNNCRVEGSDYALVLSDSASLLLTDDLFANNYCAVWAYPGSTTDIRGTMFVYHDWTLVFEGASADISNSLLLLHFVGIKGSDTLESDINVSCSNFFSQFAHDYSDTPDQTGLNGNISLDPFWCDSIVDTSLSVAGISPLLPANNPSGRMIGHAHVGCCCVGKLGNVNYDNQDVVDIVDVQTLIDNLFLTLTPVSCPSECDLNIDDSIDIADLQILIDNQFLTLTPLNDCP